MRRNRRRAGMRLRLFLMIVLIQFTSMAVAGSIVYLLIQKNILPQLQRLAFLLVVILTSILVGTLIGIAVIQYVTEPYRELTRATKEISAGNFDVRVSVRGPREIEELAAEFNHMAKQLGSIETLRSDFISNVSHEFKTPIASIRGFARLLKKDSVLAEKKKEYLALIEKESDRLAKLAQNILLLSKLQRQEFVTDRHEFLLDEQLRESVLMLEPVWRRRRISIELDLQECVYRGSEDLLSHVWNNILDNAVKFSYENGSIGVSLKKERNEVVVSVKDNGEGMDEETLNHIFEKFYQSDHSHNREGNGLGMALVKIIVQICGGKVMISSMPKAGTEVIVRLPLQ